MPYTKTTSSVVVMLLLGVGTLGCNAAKQTGSTSTISTSVMAGAWVTTINNFIGGRTDTVTVVNLSPNGTTVYDVSPVGVISCANGGITYSSVPQPAGNSVVGPACFVALGGGCNFIDGCLSSNDPSNIVPNITSSNGSGSNGVEPLTFTIGVPANPAPNGSKFNIQYAEFGSASGTWQMDGTGTVNNGTATGTWVCDPSTPACSGMSGTFTATEQ
ncbi:MAG: hypothetical protein WA899_21680 [Candidatus Sulfotelmatobacter sp.]